MQMPRQVEKRIKSLRDAFWILNKPVTGLRSIGCVYVITKLRGNYFKRKEAYEIDVKGGYASKSRQQA